MIKVGKPLPRAHEMALLRELAPMISDVRASVKSITTTDGAERLGIALSRRWSDERLRKIVGNVGVGVEAAGSRPWGPLLRRIGKRDRMDAAPIDGRKLVDEWTREAFGLIKSIRGEVAAGLRKDVIRALNHGESIEALQRKWISQGIPVEFGTMEGRIKTIARHQVTMLNSKVQAFRAEQVGVSEFVWHKNTERHAAYDGRTFTYAAGSEVGLPGQPINCQCWAESVIPDALVKELGLSSVFER